jgi:hypothetical protein
MANITVSVTGVGGTAVAYGFGVIPTPSGATATGGVGSPVIQTSIPFVFPVDFTTTQGSTLVTVNHGNFGSKTGDTVVLSNFDFGAGVYADLVALLNGEHVITKITNGQYTFNLSAPAPHSVVQSGQADVAYEIDIGLDTVIAGPGWGAGVWGRGPWGSAANVTAGDILRIWKHDNFGEDLIYNIVDGQIYYWDASQGFKQRGLPLSHYNSDAPTVARQTIVSDRDRHVILFGTNAIGSTDQDKLLIRFSDQENPFEWRPTASNTAGDIRIGNGSEIVQAVETRREIVIITDSSVHSMQFIGPPFTFGVTQISNQTTIRGVNAAVAVGDAVFWMGINRFYAYSGRVQPLPCTVRDHVFDDFNEEQSNKVYAGSNAEFGEVFWFYPSASSEENDKYVIYNYEQKIWYVGNLERTSWIDRGSNEFPIATTSEVNTVTPLKMYDHERGFDADGEAITAFIESAPIDIGDGENFTFIRRMIPDITFDASDSSATKEATFTLKSQRFPGSGFTSSKALTVTDTTEQNHTRLRGRSFGLRVESDNQGVFWRLGSPRVDIRSDGRR